MFPQRKVFDRYLTEQEEKQLFRTVAKYGDVLAQRDAAWMMLLRQSGIRVGALSGLSVEDAQLALRSGQLTIRPEISKGHRQHQVFLNKKMRAALQALLRLRRELGHANHPAQPLIMSRNHRGMSVRSFQARMRQWVELAGLDVQASPHWFRHTIAKRAIARSTAKDPRAIAQAILGHASVTSTTVYTLPDREDLRQAMEEVA